MGTGITPGSAPNQETSQVYMQLGTSSSEGAQAGKAATDLVGLFGAAPVPQRSNPMQQIIQGFSGGQVIVFGSNQVPLANVAASTTAEQANMTLEGLLSTDVILAVSKATANANTGVCGYRVSAVNTVALNFSGPSNANANLASNEVQWSVAVARGMNSFTQNLVPTVVAANSTSEQTFTVGGSGATATAYVNGAGQITGINVTASGTGYAVPPQVVITPSGSTGIGATAQAVVASSGVVSAIVTDPGSGYTTAPTISFLSSSYVAPGMMVSVSKAASQAGLGIGNVRIPAKNQIAITYFNNSAANITPTANEAYTIIALNELPAANPAIQIRANLANFTATAANAGANTTAITIPGLLTSDLPLQFQPLTILAAANVGSFNPGNCTANTLNTSYAGGVAAWTPANGTYMSTIQRSVPLSPMTLWQQLITPTSVAAQSAAEQTFTVSNASLLANWTNYCPICVSKPSYTSGIGILGARQASANTIGINFQNVLTTAVTPPAEVYTFASFPTPLATANANLIATSVYQAAGVTFNQIIDLINELQAAAALLGMIKGG